MMEFNIPLINSTTLEVNTPRFPAAIVLCNEQRCNVQGSRSTIATALCLLTHSCCGRGLGQAWPYFFEQPRYSPTGTEPSNHATMDAIVGKAKMVLPTAGRQVRLSLLRPNITMQLTLCRTQLASAAAGDLCRVQSGPSGAKLGQVQWLAQRVTRALLELEEVQEQAARNAGLTARSARNKLGQVWHAAKSASTRMKAARRAAGLSAELDGADAQIVDLAREVAALGVELAACSSDLPRVGASRKHVALTGCAATGCAATASRGWKAGRRRTTGSATSATEDNLRARLRALLAQKRSMRAMRARVGPRPAVVRRPAFRSRHTAMAREFYQPAAPPCSEAGSGGERLAQNKVDGLRVLLAQHKAKSARKLATLSAVDGGSNDDSCAAMRAEGDNLRRARV